MAARWIPWREAHGRYEHWLWPLYYPENYNAGCQQCHASDMITEHAPVLNTAKRAFPRTRLHRLPPLSRDSITRTDQLIAARQQIRSWTTTSRPTNWTSRG